MMYEYQYIAVETGGGVFFNNRDAAHRQVIEEEARAGWRYVGYVPLEFTGSGSVRSIDLIFERETDR